MTRPRLYLLSMLALALTVPWLFTGDSDARIFGLPIWAAYAVGASFLYACLISFCVGRYWELSAGGDDDSDGEGEGE